MIDPWIFVNVDTFQELEHWQRSMYYNAVRNLTIKLTSRENKLVTISEHMSKIVKLQFLDPDWKQYVTPLYDMRLAKSSKNLSEIIVRVKKGNTEYPIAKIVGDDVVDLRAIRDFELGSLTFHSSTETGLSYIYNPPNIPPIRPQKDDDTGIRPF